MSQVVALWSARWTSNLSALVRSPQLQLCDIISGRGEETGLRLETRRSDSAIFLLLIAFQGSAWSSMGTWVKGSKS